MSIRIPRDTLTEEQKKQIFRDLSFRPKSEYFAGGVIGGSTPDPIMFYVADNNYVYLPYKYAEKLTGLTSTGDWPLAKFRFTQELLPHQPSAVEEAIQHLDREGTTLLNLYTGFGKTVLAAYLGAKSRLKLCILMNSSPLLPQWKSTFDTMTDAKIWIVGEKMPNYDPDVILLMSGRYEHVPDKMRKEIGFLIIDECHKFCTPTSVAPILAFSPKFLIGCSATPKKANGLHEMLYALIGRHQVYRPLDKQFSVTCFRTGICPELKQNKMGSLDWSAVVRDLCGDELRNSMILEWVLTNITSKQLILTWNADHAFFLHKLLVANGVKAAIMARNLKTYSDSQVLVGTIGKIGTGFDEKAACSDFGGERIRILLLVGSTKNTELLTQLTGRVFRSEMPHIVDFVDEVPCIKGKHWTERRKWYEEHKAPIEEVCTNGAKPGRKRKQKSQNVTEAHLSSIVALCQQ